MALITLNDAKEYLRVDSTDEDALIGVLLSSAEGICADVARLSDEQWADIDGNAVSTERYTGAELSAVRGTMRVAVLYTLGYLFEHREEANHHNLLLTLRSILFAVREGSVL